MSKNNGGPAFPHHELDHHGMTLRDYFAAKAMEGMLAKGQSTADVSRWAYFVADAMLKAREE